MSVQTFLDTCWDNSVRKEGNKGRKKRGIDGQVEDGSSQENRGEEEKEAQWMTGWRVLEYSVETCNNVEHTHTASEYSKLSSSPSLLLLLLPLFALLSTANNYHISNILPDVLAPVSTNIHHLLKLSSVWRHQHYLSIWNLFASTDGENLAKCKNK